MAKKVLAVVKLQCPAGQANPAPPVGPALGQHGVNIVEFCKAFNARTQDQQGMIIPALITVYADRSFTFELKTPPAAILLKKAAKLEKGSGEPNRNKVGKVTRAQLEEIAGVKMADLNANDMGRRREHHRWNRPIDGHRGGGVGMPKSSKRYLETAETVDRDKLYEVGEAVELIKSWPRPKFDESVDLALNLGVDPKHADQMVRGALVLPHGTGKDLRILVFAKGEKEKEAQEAGADYVGGDDLAKKIQDEGWMEFERVIATPDMMAVVGRLGKVLGPRGLMPNPKLGTVTPDVGRAVSENKAGKVEYRVDKNGIVHCAVAKVSFDPAQIVDNATALIDAVIKAKPAASKGVYLKKISISTTMGPGLRIDPASVKPAA